MNSRLLILAFVVLVGTNWLRQIGMSDDLSPKQVAWFETNIRPILATKCYSCHSVEKGEQEGGLTLDSKTGWEQGGDHGTAIVPKDVDASLLIRAVRYKDPDLEMPPDKPLTERQVKLLEQWVQMGAPDPRQQVASTSKFKNPSDPELGKSHWAFQRLDSPRPPEVPRPARDWPTSPVDNFVLQQLNSKGLHPNPQADPRTLYRRLSMLLVGLPPTKTELDEFAANTAPDAYERLVDRLLSSPQFGEVWGRHWLDLARYADSNGLDENFLFREAWRYRKWVIHSINQDRSFDEFTRIQIAGDLLPYQSVEQRDQQRIGAGFLVVGPKVLLGVNGELQKMDVADELISTIGTTFLGQTLGCARCHDHKFDPVPTEDYYALAGIFTSTEVMQTRYMLGQQRKMERLFGLGAEENELNAAYEKYWRERGKLKSKLDQAKRVLEALKKTDTNLKELVKTSGDHLSADLKKQLIKWIEVGVTSFNVEPARRVGNSVASGLTIGPIKRLATKSTDSVAKDVAEELNQKTAIRMQQQYVNRLAKQHSQPPAIPPRAMIPVDKSKPANEAVRIAGQFQRKGKTVPRGFLEVLTQKEYPIPDQSSGRLELADWLTDVDGGAGNLTARVLANRVWHHLLGQGIVKTTDNFGRTGTPPSHPELLDFLAGELVNSGWSIKKLIKTVVLSQTFCQSSSHQDPAHQIDPDNRLLWRANRRRLSPESFRDAVLFAANHLDQRPLNSTVNYLGDQATAVGANKNRRRTDFPNRSVYLPVIRNDLPEIFEAFDFANAHRPTGNRPETTVATTGLFILNDRLMLESSKTMARGLLAMPGVADSERVGAMFERILGVSSSDYEIKQVLNHIGIVEKLSLNELKIASKAGQPVKKPVESSVQIKTEKSTDKQGNQNSQDSAERTADLNEKMLVEARLRAWATACHALFASSRFQVLE